MKKIGVLFGMENTFPAALVERINAMDAAGITAEFVRIGDVRMAEGCGYDVIVDRISHDIPFYRAWLKNSALCGAKVINNPFWWSADDKFFNYALATKLGVAIPPTVLLPHKEHPTGTTERSMRNLHYPLDWDSIFKYVGFPAFLKPFDGGGWRDVYKINNKEEFFSAYDQTRTLCMTLQRAVNFREYFRCYVVGQDRCTSCPTTRARRSTSATCGTLRSTRRSCSRASRRTRRRCAARSATTSTPSSSRARTAFHMRSTS
jgi:glutathione synthase/RimK-type ligase-like ATP-grasp enzyme